MRGEEEERGRIQDDSGRRVEEGWPLPVSDPLPYPEVTDKGKREGAREEMQRAQRGDPGGAVLGREPASSY